MNGMIVAPQVQAAEHGYRVLASGGNAIDAAVTAAFVQTVVDPQMAGIAGFGAATVHTRDGETEVIDFNGTAGSRARPDMWVDKFIEQDWTGYGYHVEGRLNDIGYQSIMTPGTVAGLAALLERYGTISWKDAIQPAIDLALEGFPVPPSLWLLWNMPLRIGISFHDRLKATEGSRMLYFKNDHETLAAGEILRNPDYGRTLQLLAKNGPEDFYTGELASRMLEDLDANGALITTDDLAGYQPRISEPVSGTYRDWQVQTNPPAGGGPCLLEILNILEHEDLKALKLNSVEYIDFVARTMQAGYHDWYSFVGDPAHIDVPLDDMLSDQRANEWFARIRQGEQIRVPLRRESPGTTHVTVADSQGNIIALTHSLGGSSGVVTEGLGFTYNNIMNAADPVPGGPNQIAPGKSRVTGICPTIVFDRDQPVLALGAPGGTRIITGVLQVLINVLDHGLSPQEAVDAPRFDCQSEILDAEASIPRFRLDELGRRGFRIAPRAAPYGPHASFGLVQAIGFDASTNKMRGGGDLRGDSVVFTD